MSAIKMIIKGDGHLCSFLLVFVLIPGMAVSGWAENRIGFGIGQTGTHQPVDTVYLGGQYEFQIYIENDVTLSAMSVGNEFWSDSEVFLNWAAQPDGLGTRTACVTVMPECRLDPAAGTGSFDMTGLLVTEQNIDEISADTIMFGGVGYDVGLEPGPLEHMISYNFRPVGPLISGYIGTICIDTTNVPPCGYGALFVDLYGTVVIPQVDDALCVPVKVICGNPNGDDDVNVGDCVFMINHIFRDGPAPVPWQLGDANCDGVLDVGDVVFLIAASFRSGPQPECPDYEMSPLHGTTGDAPTHDHDFLPNDILCDTLFFPNQ